MLKRVILAATLATTMTPMAQAKEVDGKQVTVLGRNWVVTPVKDAPGRFRATRLNVELLPFRPPAMIGVRQATRAFKAATGCSANVDTMVKSIDGSYYAQMICPK